MFDAENLYFLADVFDATRQASSSEAEPYKGDSIELFLVADPPASLARNGGPFAPGGRQSCWKRYAPPLKQVTRWMP